MPSGPDAIVLCGGAGLRLRSVTGDAPKSLANIGGRPFLEILLSQLRRQGFERVILAVGYQRDLIREHFGDGGAYGLAVIYAIEAAPLGTGGALRNAVDLIESEDALIMNGDSYTDGDLAAFVADYRRAKADISMLVVPADGRVDCGLVSVDADGKVLGFKEKQSAAGTPFVNAGIYLATKSALAGIQRGMQISLETDLFPRWLAEGRYLRAFQHSGECVDIGTPERYQRAQITLANAEAGDEFAKPRGQRA
ncbi:MAG: nucleotidyltransferase family protein [Candidatus Acidiferrales bacterium]